MTSEGNHGWVQAQGKAEAEEEEKEDGEITDSEKQMKAEEKKQKARDDHEAAQRELKVHFQHAIAFESAFALIYATVLCSHTSLDRASKGGQIDAVMSCTELCHQVSSWACLPCRHAGGRLATSSS